MKTVDQRSVGYLPAELTSFVGRRQVSAEVKRLLSSSRLVTLTGPGGVGKTRLAVHVARELRRAFPDGVWLVELAKLQDPGVVVNAVATALELPDQSARDLLAVLAEFLADKRLLIVLDNCEHVLPASAAVVSSVLQSTPSVRVLTTSRERLGVTGEQVFPVPPLAVPRLYPSNGGQKLQSDAVGQNEAVLLFEERAAAVWPEFTVNRDNEVAVTRLCQQLDGLPLAIELAAVQLRALSVEQILQHLQDRFRLLSAGIRDTPDRHQTLQAAVEWSFDLCSPLEQMLWARLSVFAGDFDLEAAQHVCADAEVTEGDVLDGVSALVDKSVLTRVQYAGSAYYRMLEIIRQYGRKQLAARDEEMLMGRCHRDYYLGLAEQADAQWFGPLQRHWLQRFQGQRPNLWATLDFCCTQPEEARTGLRLAGALWFYWVACGFIRDGRYWLDRALALSPEPSPQRAKALWVDGWTAIIQGDLRHAERVLQESLELANEIGDRTDMAYATQLLGWHAAFFGNMARAAELEEQALDQHRALGQLLSPALRSLYYLAVVHLERGDLDRAITFAEEGRSICERAGEEWMLGWMRWAVGAVRRVAGALQAAEDEARAALRLAHQFDDVLCMTLSLMLLALVAMDRGDAERAARLLGALEPLWKQMGSSPLLNAAFLLRWHRDCEERARKTLGERAYKEAYRHGRQLGTAPAVTYALGEKAPVTSSPAGAPAAVSAESVLTRREREVANLVAQGLSNKDIASRLVISQRTAEAHVEHILSKLGATSRTQIATWVANQRDREDEADSH